jgi:dihydrofolate reductase
MAKLTYTVNTSLDGFMEDEHGSIDFTEPSPEVHQFINDLTRPTGTFLFGRRMYETMAVWETMGSDPDATPVTRDFAEVWHAADKVVYSRTLDAVSTPNTRLEREFDPEAVRRLKDTAERDLNIGGPDLARHAFAARLVDEVQQFVAPIVIGGGKPALPRGIRTDLELLDERRFDNGTVFLLHRCR